MAVSRLTDSQKSQLVDGYRSGKSTTSLAELYGCSPNTVNRTVKAFLPKDEYTALKAARARGDAPLPTQEVVVDGSREDPMDPAGFEGSSELETITKGNQSNSFATIPSNPLSAEAADNLDFDKDSSGPLALDDADDFEDQASEDAIAETSSDSDAFEQARSDIFKEVVPLASGLDFLEPQKVECEPLSPGVLPSSVYMLVEKSVELDSRPLKEFPEFSSLADADQQRQAICLFATQRAAKRHCGRNQRVIKIPDTAVFELSTRFLLARGVTCLVLEGSLISLDGSSVLQD